MQLYKINNHNAMKKYLYIFFFSIIVFEAKSINVTSTGADFNNPYLCSEGVYSFVATPGLSNYSWQVSDADDAIILTGSGPTFTINGGLLETIQAGMFTVSNSIVVTVTAFNGVSTESWISPLKQVKGSPLVKLMEDASFCPNATVSMSNLTSPGSGTYSYNWYFNNGNTAISTNASHTATAAGIYKLEVTETTFQCIATDEVVLQAQPAPVFSGVNSPQFKCYSEDYQFNISTPTQLNWPITCNWSGANSPLSFNASQNVLNASTNTNPKLFAPLSPTVPSPTNITVEATNSKGCKTTAVINVVFNLPITGGITTPNNSVLCKYGNYTLINNFTGGNGGLTYLWSPSNGLNNVTVSSPAILPQSETGTLYTLVAKDSRNCTVSSSVTIKKSTLGLTFKNHNSDAITRCLGAAIPIEVGRSKGVPSFTIAAPGLIAQGNDSTYLTPVLTGNAKYIVTVTDNAGCTDKDSLEITAVGLPSIATQPQPQIACPSTMATFDVSATGTNLMYAWSNGASITTSMMTSTLGSNYTVTISGTCGVAVSNAVSLTERTTITGIVLPSMVNVTIGGASIVIIPTLAGAGLNYDSKWSYNSNSISVAYEGNAQPSDKYTRPISPSRAIQVLSISGTDLLYDFVYSQKACASHPFTASNPMRLVDVNVIVATVTGISVSANLTSTTSAILVSILGSGFQNGATITVGGVVLTNVVVTGNMITGNIPAGSSVSNPQAPSILVQNPNALASVATTPTVVVISAPTSIYSRESARNEAIYII
ncbi:MAG: PKD domain-containing protein [Bacteroidetes bacterium]|nr:MAG: PKD domain-containing protein [Bacteroidota bacterium]